VGGAELTGAVTGAAPKDEAKRRTSNVPVCNERSAASTDFALKAELLSRNLQRQATSKNQTNGELLHHSDASEDALPCPKANIWAARHLDLLKELLQIIMLYSCGQVALYTLSLFFGINASAIGAAWHVFALLPPIITLFVLLPHLCHSLALFEAYAVPNAPILDNVISDLDQRAMDLAYLKAQLAKRVDDSLDSANHRFGRHLAERLEQFELQFDWKYTPVLRWWRAFRDLARGQALCFVDRRACFLVGVLEESNVPASRERLERLVPWYKREVAPKDETLAVADIFRALSVEPPAMCRGRGTTEINVRQSQHSNENL